MNEWRIQILFHIFLKCHFLIRLSNNNNLTIKISPKQYPESNVLTTVSKSIDNTTTKIDFRARGRQARIRVSCESNNAEWEWGSIRLAFQGDGAR